MTDDQVEIETLYTPNRPWGDDTFVVDGKHYRRATKREEPDFIIETEFGDVELRRLTRNERRYLEDDYMRQWMLGGKP